jgi:hypothetical protein
MVIVGGEGELDEAEIRALGKKEEKKGKKKGKGE